MEKPYPLNVAIAAVMHEGKILLIKRAKNPYQGLWALPGGKVEFDEHIKDSAIREIYEETGINTTFESYSGICSEIIKEEGRVLFNFVLHIITLNAPSLEAVEQNEGELAWFDLDAIEDSSRIIIPSDFLIIQKIIKNKEMNSVECLVEKTGEIYNLVYFR